jgi:hypothetical protein
MMSLAYHMPEGSLVLPGIERDATLNVVHFVNEQGRPRQMIVSREKLKAGSTLQATVDAQLGQLRKESRHAKVGDVETCTLSAANWPALQVGIILNPKGANTKSWQLHVMAQTPDDLLLTITLVATEPLAAEELQQWLARLQTFVPRGEQAPHQKA